MQENHKFQLKSSFKPKGSQPDAIRKLTQNFSTGKKIQPKLL